MLPKPPRRITINAMTVARRHERDSSTFKVCRRLIFFANPMSTRIILIIAAAAFLDLFAVGCASQRVTVAYVDRQFKPPVRGVQPVLEGSINGVPGRFVIDTGAMAPMLSQTAIERCGITAIPSEGFGLGVGGKIALLQATNVTFRVAPDFAIHWRTIMVFSKDISVPSETNDDFFGILDYRTLEAWHAVMDMKNKTITLTK